MTATELLARCQGVQINPGGNRCFYCGASCDESHSVTTHRSDGFTGWDRVAFPASDCICVGCVIATTEPNPRERPRLFTWIISTTGIEKYTKGDMDAIRAACLRPPKPPYAIALAVSGKKHLLYHAPVNESPDMAVVQFEMERIGYRPADLAGRLELCQRICAATGKPAMTESPAASLPIRLAHYYRDFEPLLIWNQVWAEPLSRVAAWLCPKKEECQYEYPSDIAAAPADIRRGRMAVQTGRVDGPGLFG